MSKNNKKIEFNEEIISFYPEDVIVAEGEHLNILIKKNKNKYGCVANKKCYFEENINIIINKIVIRYAMEIKRNISIYRYGKFYGTYFYSSLNLSLKFVIWTAKNLNSNEYCEEIHFKNKIFENKKAATLEGSPMI